MMNPFARLLKTFFFHGILGLQMMTSHGLRLLVRGPARQLRAGAALFIGSDGFGTSPGLARRRHAVL